MPGQTLKARLGRVRRGRSRCVPAGLGRLLELRRAAPTATTARCGQAGTVREVVVYKRIFPVVGADNCPILAPTAGVGAAVPAPSENGAPAVRRDPATADGPHD